MEDTFAKRLIIFVVWLGPTTVSAINYPFQKCKESYTDLLFITDTSMPNGCVGPEELKASLLEMVELYVPLVAPATSRLRMSVVVDTPTGPTTPIHFANDSDSDSIREAISNLTSCLVPQTTPIISDSTVLRTADFINNAFSEAHGGRPTANHVAIVIINGNKPGAIEDIDRINRGKLATIQFLAIITYPPTDYRNALYPNTLSVPDFSSLVGNQLISMALCQKCKSGWIGFQQYTPFYQFSCYHWDFDPVNQLDWYQSATKCGKMGANLVSIGTQEELDFLQEELYGAYTGLGDLSIKWEVHIGVRRDYRVLPRRFRWMDGRPLVVSHLQGGRPLGSDVQECGIWRYQPPEVRNGTWESVDEYRGQGKDGWVDVGCGRPQSHVTLCEVALDNSSEMGEHFMGITPARRGRVVAALGRGEFIESEGRIVSIPASVQSNEFYNKMYRQQNDEFPLFDCEDGEDNNKLISYSYVCDYIQHCRNNRDEEVCLYARCDESNEFECQSRQCVPRESRCDAYADCYDGSDENNCIECKQRRCCDGSCVPKHWQSYELECSACLPADTLPDMNNASPEGCALVCNGSSCVALSQLGDGVVDCTGQEGPIDETIGRLPRTDSCASNNYSTTSWSPLCVYVKDRYGGILGCSDVSHLWNCENATCPEGYTQCAKSYCIPLHFVLDGKMDCPLGEDEQYREEHNCTGNFACWNSRVCLHPDLVCDGNPDCPSRDDEKNCHVTCEVGFRCIGGTVKATTYNRNIPLDSLAFLDPGTQFLNLSGIDVSPAFSRFEKRFLKNIMTIILSNCKIVSVDASFASDVSSLQSVYSLDLSYNRISQIPTNSIIKFMTNLHILNVSHNTYLTRLEENAFGAYYGLSVLERIDLSYTGISDLGSSVLTNLLNLKVLDVRHTRITKLHDNTFPRDFKLNEIYLHGTSILDFDENSFNGLFIKEGLYTDNFELCCPQIRGPGVEERLCHAPNDAISTCFDLIGLTIQRCLLWFVGFIAVIGNLSVICCRLTWNKSNITTSYGMFVTNLGVSDLIMGVYLLIIASADIVYREQYVTNVIQWKHSVVCHIAGFLSTLSSETSAFFVLLITVDRYLVLKFPFGQYSISRRCSYITSTLAWGSGFTLALVPSLPEFKDWTIFYSNGMCLGLPLTTENLGGWQYSIAIFVGVNTIMFLFIAFGQLSIYRAISGNTAASASVHGVNRRARDIAIAKQLSFVVLTDFLCYFPVGLMGLLAITGHDIGKDAYSWSAVLVLPVNSAINPLLYTVPFIEAKWDQFKRSHCRRGTPNNIDKAVAISIKNQNKEICRQIKTISV